MIGSNVDKMMRYFWSSPGQPAENDLWSSSVLLLNSKNDIKKQSISHHAFLIQWIEFDGESSDKPPDRPFAGCFSSCTVCLS